MVGITAGITRRRPQLHPDTQDYARRIIQNSGTINPPVLRAIDRHITRPLIAAGLKGKVRSLAPLSGNSLTAALVPLWGVSLGNVGFIEADYSQSAGLKGGLGKYLNMGINPLETGLSTANIALGVYGAQLETQVIDAGVAVVYVGAFETGTSTLASSLSPTNLQRAVVGAAGASPATSGVAPIASGFLLASSISLSNLALYQFNSSGGLVVDASSATRTGTSPNLSIFAFGRNENGSLLGRSAMQARSLLIAEGLTQVEAATVYTALHNFNSAIGRAA